jgi:hypothetical protein
MQVSQVYTKRDVASPVELAGRVLEVRQSEDQLLREEIPAWGKSDDPRARVLRLDSFDLNQASRSDGVLGHKPDDPR